MLKGISSTLSPVCRKYDIITRYVGEEFGVILPHTPTEKAKLVADRILSSLSHKQYNPVCTSITASAGISAFTLHAEEKNDLIQKADIALYHSKESGKNRSAVYSIEIDTLVCN